MFMAIYSAYDSSDVRGSMPFTGFLTALFKKHGFSIPIDLIMVNPDKPIDNNSLTRSEVQKKKKRKIAASSLEAVAVGIAEL